MLAHFNPAVADPCPRAPRPARKATAVPSNRRWESMKKRLVQCRRIIFRSKMTLKMEAAGCQPAAPFSDPLKTRIGRAERERLRKRTDRIRLATAGQLARPSF